MGEHTRSEREVSWSLVGGQLVVVIILTVVALVVAFAATMMRSERAAFTSAEVKFTDASPSGLSIVPASCPSNPHAIGECTTSPQPPGNGCSITALSDVLAPGGSTTLSWVTSNYQWFGTSVSPSNGFITPGIGGVNPTGLTSIAPSQTTTYALTGSYRVFGVPVGSYSCSHTVYVLNCSTGYTLQNGQCELTTCSAGHVLQNGQCVLVAHSACTPQLICQGNYSVYQAANCALSQWQLCDHSCYAGGCTVPSPSIVDWSVRPLLVQRDTPVWVSWQAQNVQSCTVRGTNGDGSGSNATGLWNTTTSSGATTTSPITSQTVYTITCQGFAGASPSTVTRSTTVNIAPTFNDP